MEEQGRAYQTKANARRDDCNQHRGREACKDNERSSPRDVPRMRGHLRGARMCQYLVLEDVIGDVNAYE